MPRGTPIDETGLLLHENGELILRRDGGGRWRLDAARRHFRLAGRRVRMIGTRAEFDLVDVSELHPL